MRLINVDSATEERTYIACYADKIRVVSDVSSSVGLSGANDFTANISALDYPQKKYVDQQIADTSLLLRSLISGLGTGTVTSVATDNTLTGGTITSSGTLKVDTTVISTKGNVTGLLLNKQDNLISGTNIKTINSTSLLGSGNIVTPDAQTLTAGTNTLTISGGNTVNLNRKADTAYYFRNATLDSTCLIVIINGISYRSCAKDSVGSGGGGSSSLSSLTAATATNNILNTNYKQRWNWNTIASDTALVLNSTSTAAASNVQTVLAVNQSGANATSTQSTYGIKLSNVKTGTAATNIGLNIVCSGAATNTALNIESGTLKMNNNYIYLGASNNYINEIAGVANIGTSSLRINTSNGSAGHSITVNDGGYYQFSTGMYNSYTAPYFALGGANWNGGTTFYCYGSNAILFKDIAGDLAITQDAGITYNTTFTPTERVRFKVDGSIGVGTASPAASAILDLTSTTRGLLPPRMTTTQRDAISSPTEGLIIYDLTLHKLCIYTGSSWEIITSL